jgi:hypothetical protein
MNESVSELKSMMMKRRDDILSSSNKQLYDIIDIMMKKISKTHDISDQELHDRWVKKYKMTPDEWIKKQ